MLRLLNTTTSRRLLGLALAGALAFSAASFALPAETRAADDNQGCPGVVATQNGSLDMSGQNASIETSGGDAQLDLSGGDDRSDIDGGDAHIETSGGDLTASLENLVSDTNCRVR
jgi:hypothetical protein